MEAKLTSDKDEFLFLGDGCCNVVTLFKPADLANCLGNISKDLSCCVDSSSANCILKEHPMFDELIEGEKEGVCCICNSGQTVLVKPLCLTNEKPCMKKSMVGCCCSQRCAIPGDVDTPRVCVMYGLKLCKCFPFEFTGVQCCEPITPLPPTSMPEKLEVEEARMSTEYMICSGGCCMMTMYVPDTRTDAFGLEDKSMCCCTSMDTRNCMLPKRADGYEMVLLQGGQIKVINPPVLNGGPLCKGVKRNFFTITKFAFPCDEEVPFAIACCGYKCAYKPPGEPVQWCNDDRVPDQNTGLKPMFPELAAQTGGGAPDGQQMAR